MDGETWQHYGEDLETNLQTFSERLKRGAYRAKPVRRAYVPKDDGRERPIGVPVLEDKIVQRSAAEVIGGIFEADFKGFSYGFRPGRSQHNALDAVRGRDQAEEDRLDSRRSTSVDSSTPSTTVG